jgi:hypothetical protein
MHIQPKVSIASIDVNIYPYSQFYYKHQMTEQTRLSRVVEVPSEKQKEYFNHNKKVQNLQRKRMCDD